MTVPDARELDVQSHGQVHGRGEALPIWCRLEESHQDCRNRRRSHPEDPHAQVSFLVAECAHTLQFNFMLIRIFFFYFFFPKYDEKMVYSCKLEKSRCNVYIKVDSSLLQKNNSIRVQYYVISFVEIVNSLVIRLDFLRDEFVNQNFFIHILTYFRRALFIWENFSMHSNCKKLWKTSIILRFS